MPTQGLTQQRAASKVPEQREAGPLTGQERLAWKSVRFDMGNNLGPAWTLPKAREPSFA